MSFLPRTCPDFPATAGGIKSQYKTTEASLQSSEPLAILMSSHSSFDMLPEELTEQILSLCVTASFEPPPPRPIWLAPAKSRPQSVSKQDRRCSAIRTRLAPLLVSKTFHRISTPHYCSTVRITSPEQAAAFLRALQTQHIAPYVRRFLSSSILPTLGAVLQHCKNINYIDISLDSGSSSSIGVDSVTEEFCNALDTLECVKHISLRKASNTYLTLPRVRYTLTRLAVTVEKWTSLVRRSNTLLPILD